MYHLVSKNQAVCIIEITKVTICPYHEVAERQAYLEGEGDRTLPFWRMVHKQFFSEEFKAYELEFTEDMLVVCEKFKVIYRNKE